MAASGAGLTVSAGDPEAILGAIEILAEDPELAEKYGENGCRYAAEHLTGAASLERKASWVRRLAARGVQPRTRRPAANASRYH
jgi:glycosyltransferase involved in cell wall biosynthesis